MPFTNGQRVVDPNDVNHTIWLIDNGFRRMVSNQVNVNLFTDMIGVISDASITTVPISLPMPATSGLQTATSTNAVFLVESTACRRLVKSGTVFSQWHFNPAKVVATDAATLLAIPCGPDVT